MSFQALAWAASQTTGSLASKSVLLALANYADEEGCAYPSTAAIAAFGEMDHKTATAALDRLIEAGFIADTGERAGRTKQVKVYKLHLNSTPKTEAFQNRKPPVSDPKDPQKRGTDTIREPVSQKASPSSRAREKSDRYHRLPEGWEPTKPLPEALAMKVAQWPPGKLESEIEAMREWAVNAKNENGKGKKLCWDTALHGWLRRADDDWRAKPANRNPANCNPGLGRTAAAAISVFGPPGGETFGPAPSQLRRIGVG